MPEDRRDGAPHLAVALAVLRLQPAHERLRGREPHGLATPRRSSRRPAAVEHAGSSRSSARPPATRRTTTAAATSSAVAEPALRDLAEQRRPDLAGRRAGGAVIAVRTNVGATDTTRMPSGASSTASALVSPSSACLVAQYTRAVARRRRGPSARRRRRSAAAPPRAHRRARRLGEEERAAHVERRTAGRTSPRVDVDERLGLVGARRCTTSTSTRSMRANGAARSRPASVRSQRRTTRPRRRARATLAGDALEVAPRCGRASTTPRGARRARSATAIAAPIPRLAPATTHVPAVEPDAGAHARRARRRRRSSRCVAVSAWPSNALGRARSRPPPARRAACPPSVSRW